jgi:hypothetical protein
MRPRPWIPSTFSFISLLLSSSLKQRCPVILGCDVGAPCALEPIYDMKLFGDPVTLQ